MNFQIITPSYNQLEFLQRCVASVRDQVSDGVRCEDIGVKQDCNLKHNARNLTHQRTEPILVHHHIQDACSPDGTAGWLERYTQKVRAQTTESGQPSTQHVPPNTAISSYAFSYESVPDDGMYDALNRGIERLLDSIDTGSRKPGAENEITSSDPLSGRCGSTDVTLHAPRSQDTVIAWLNCDEQYLSNTLEKVATFFESHPDVDVLCGDALIVEKSGKLAAFWKAMPLRWKYVQSYYLYNLSCAMFFRASVFEQGLRFDSLFKAVSDQEFISRLLRKGVRTALAKEYLAAYTILPENLSMQIFAVDEREKLRNRLSRIDKMFRPAWCMAQKMERVMRGCRWQTFPLEYELYLDKFNERVVFKSERVPACWPGRQ